jgi:hypothetical protein
MTGEAQDQMQRLYRADKRQFATGDTIRTAGDFAKNEPEYKADEVLLKQSLPTSRCEQTA